MRTISKHIFGADGAVFTLEVIRLVMSRHLIGGKLKSQVNLIFLQSDAGTLTKVDISSFPVKERDEARCCSWQDRTPKMADLPQRAGGNIHLKWKKDRHALSYGCKILFYSYISGDTLRLYIKRLYNFIFYMVSLE